MSRKIVVSSLLLLLLLTPNQVRSQTVATGRIFVGTLASRPTCGTFPNAQNGDIWTDVDDANSYKCFGGVWSGLGSGAISPVNSPSPFVFNTDMEFKGPNPYIDIRNYCARPVLGFATTANITSGTNTATLASASNFVNCDGITITGAGPTPTMTTPSAPGVSAANASLLPGTGINVANTSGATTYQYQVAAVDALGGVTIASAVTSIANGPATLGAQTVNIASWTRSNNIVTVTTSAPYNFVATALVSITVDNFIAGTYQVATTPDNTHFTFQTAQDTRNGAPTVGGAGGVVTYWLCNHLNLVAVAGAWKYIIFGRTAGSMVRIGESLPETAISYLHADPLYNTFDDFGATMSAQSGEPFWYPNTPPVAVKNQDLITSIVSGAGTVNVVLANNASNTVVGATATAGNDVAILTAAKAAAGVTGSNPGILFIPETPTNQAYSTTSVLNLTTFPQKLGVIQAGTFFPGDTVILGNGNWTGSPRIPLDSPSFGWENYPKIIIAGNPGIYTTNSGSVMSYISLTNNVGNQALLYLADTGGIPASRWEHMNFATVAANDCMGRHLILRNDITGAANYTLSHTTMAAGNCSVASFAPLFQHTQNGGSPFTLDHIFLNKRGMYWGGGFQGTIDNVYEQAASMPKLFFGNTTAGLATLAIDIRNSIEDTTSQPIVTYTTFQTGVIRIFGSNGIPSGVQVSGPGGITISLEGSGAVSSLYNHNTFSKIGPITGGAIDGRLSTAGGSSYSETLFNMGLSLGAPYKLFINSVAQVAPTCVVSAGGTVTVGSYNFTVAPVFPDGSEGTMSQQSPTCTTTGGNQVITINWTVVPGATGYDLYRNGFSFQCTPPWVAGGASTSYVWSGASPCGQGAPPLTGGGPTDILGNAVVTPQYALTAANGGGYASITMPTATAPSRSITVPDANGVIALVPAVGTNTVQLGPLNPTHEPVGNVSGLLVDGVTPMGIYDSFDRANGSLTSGNPNWTVVSGGFNISSNAVVFTNSGSNQNVAVYTGVSFPTDDQTTRITVNQLAGGAGTMRAHVRASSTVNTSYFMEFGSSSAAGNISKVIAGAYTTLVGCTAPAAPQLGDIIELNVKGTTLTGFFNGAQLCQVTDASIGVGGYPGIGGFNGQVSITVADFTASFGGVSLNVAQTWNALQNFGSGASFGNAPITCGAATGCISLNEASTAGGNAGTDTLRGDSVDHVVMENLNNSGEQPLPQRVMTTGAYTNATTTASNITGLSFTVGASRNYTTVCHLYYQGSVATAGLDITVTGPAAPTSVFYSYDEDATSTSLQNSVASAFSTKLVGNATVTATTNLHATVTIGLRNGANAGTVQVQGSATGAGTVTVQAGSFCTVE